MSFKNKIYLATVVLLYFSLIPFVMLWLAAHVEV